MGFAVAQFEKNTHPNATSLPLLETPELRRQRLIDSGILEKPPEEKPIPTRLEKFTSDLSNLNKDIHGNFIQNHARFELNIGSWKTLFPPSRVKYLEDFSYGITAFFLSDEVNQNLKDGPYRIFFGPSVIFYNGGVFATTRDIYGAQTPVYANYNATELGAEFMLNEDKKWSDLLTGGWEIRAQLLPLRWVRANSNSIHALPKMSEGNSHFRGNTGMGISVGWSVSIAKAVGVGTFLSFHHSVPSQFKMRGGLSFFMLQTDVIKPQSEFLEEKTRGP